MSSSLNIMHRYLKSREIIDENSGVLASLIEADRGIDAVELDGDNIDEMKHTLGYSDLTYCLVNVDGHLLLLYPTEQRELYSEIEPQLELGDDYAEFDGFTYSEALAAKDLLSAADVPFRVAMDDSGRISFSVSNKNADLAGNAVDTILAELDSPEGKEHFISQNICWQHAVNQTSTAISYGGVSFIGSEGGSSGVRVDDEGAIVSVSGKEGRFIPRGDQNFNQKVLSAVLNDLKGSQTPVKAFYGDFAETMTEDMTPRTAMTPPMSKNEALDVLELKGIPSIDKCGKLYDEIDSFSTDEKTAFYTLLRMTMCRSQKLEEIKEHKSSRRNEDVYNKMHTSNINLFAGYSSELGRDNSAGSDSSGDFGRDDSDDYPREV